MADETLLNPPVCNHETVIVCTKMARNLTSQYWRQCLSCGSGHMVGKSHLSREEQATTKVWDESIEKAWEAKRMPRIKEYNEQRRAEENQQQQAWWHWYDEYLKTPEWAAKRKLVLERDSFTCKACGVRKATQVHHLTYEHAGDEFLFELIAICKSCHQRIHNEQRGTTA